ncbi:hypothetical protein Vspart_02173 [Vibrio spartinae]|uniref:Uncharacterized protein n=2 Tax=Vibrio spartinae TaxID=1918945 RepID=A0A1N6M5Z3_9VIBR|nr:hypothetical protein Vspart_02173 [Vibrio spartinae]SIO94777.1 hypothetical protein VSP9026_02507 [Vibrio spartinae]
MKKKIIFILIATLPIYAHAGRVTTPWFKIQEVGPDSNGPFVAIPPPGITNDCPSGFSWFPGQAEATNDGYKNSVSTVLAAFFSGKEVQLDYESSTAPCYVYQLRVR